MSVTEDASTPAVATTAGGSSATTLASASFSPPANSVLVALCVINYSTAPGSFPTITVTDSASGTWTVIPAGQVNNSSDGCALAILTRVVGGTAPGSITVTMHRGSDTSAALLGMAVRVADGANVTSPVGASHTTTGTTSPVEGIVTTTVTGSLVYFAGDLVVSATGTPTALSGTTMLYDTHDATDGGYPFIGKATSVTGTPGTGSPGNTGFTFSGTVTSWAWLGVEIVPPAPGAAALSGSGSLTAAGAFGGSAALSGSGSMTASGVFAGASALSGSGTLTATGTSSGAVANLDGEGTLGGTWTATWIESAALSGSGTLGGTVTGTWLQSAALDGEGTLGLAVTLKLVIGLSGSGSLSVPQVAGGLVNGVGGAAVPYALPGSSQVAVAPPGSSNWQWLGTLGQVTALTYSYVCPGGCDKMSATLMVPASYRTQLFNPGWQVRITRGGHTVWTGKLDEPQPSPQGWTLTAVGTGNRGQDFLAIYSSTWPASEPDQSVNNAISRGLPWVNPGIGSPSGAWFGQAVDSGAQTVTALLNLVCTRGGLTWYVNSQPGGPLGDSLSVFPLPTAVNRLLVCTTPVARTLGGDINTIFIRYESAADNATTGAAAAYATTSVQNAASVAAHGVIETYIDLSDVGVQTAAQAQAVGNFALDVYLRASFAGPFQASYGQLLNTGGTPVDPGTDQAGTVIKLVLTDFGYGGEVTTNLPITFICGQYEWDDYSQIATITPYQSLDQSITGVLSMLNSTMTPITVASG